MKPYLKNHIIITLMLLFFSATTSAKTAMELVDEAKKNISEIDSVELSSLQQQGAVIIDVREPDEFAAGHIPGAINIPRGVLEFRIDAVSPLKEMDEAARKNHPVVLYCRSGNRSALATASLHTLGFSKVHSLEGGYKTWPVPDSQPAEANQGATP